MTLGEALVLGRLEATGKHFDLFLSASLDQSMAACFVSSFYHSRWVRARYCSDDDGRQSDAEKGELMGCDDQREWAKWDY